MFLMCIPQIYDDAILFLFIYLFRYLLMTTISMTYEGCNYRLGIYSWNMSEQCYYWICEAEAERFKDMTIFRTTQGN